MSENNLFKEIRNNSLTTQDDSSCKVQKESALDTFADKSIDLSEKGTHLTQKSVLVTGASRGIGKAIAREYASHGYQLIITSHNSKEDLESTGEDIQKEFSVNCDCVVCDMSREDKVNDLFSLIENKYDGLDVLVNNAGISHIGLLQDMSYEQWNQVINTNLSSVFLTSRKAIPLMLRKHAGSIVNISSVWGLYGASCEVAYSASKGGINSFTKALAKELAPSHIQVNAIACGAIDTSMNKFLSSEEKADLINEIPYGRMGTPEEVANAAYTIGTKSSYLTGQIIQLDGGWC
ncbi:MAG: SDR family oxidoreductase [Lachnospiraceae bacterium]|jgi:3-oxoacyl-[acyl-carrier protein] reductase|nr:SDR family oxidoreductase [Lachnospiraceae bacterium]MDD3616854.1 SDR family oxidoreductase [Lachnospiraceae bacterium]